VFDGLFLIGFSMLNVLYSLSFKLAFGLEPVFFFLMEILVFESFRELKFLFYYLSLMM
jgi:hypothetical protein